MKISALTGTKFMIAAFVVLPTVLIPACGHQSSGLGKGNKEVAAATAPESSLREQIGNFKFRGDPIYADYTVQIDESFQVVMPNVGGRFANSMLSPTVADVTGDNKVEIFSLRADGKLYGFDSSGNALPNFPVDLVLLAGGTLVNNTTGHIPAIADIDGDGVKEIVAGVRLEQPMQESRLFVIEPDGSVNPNWPARGVQLGAVLNSSPTITDINNDGTPEIIIGGASLRGSSQGYLYVLKNDGTFLNPNFPFRAGSYGVSSTTAVGDLDGDSFSEMIFVGGDFKLHALNHQDGSEVTGFPVGLNAFRSSVALGDVTGDDALEIVVLEENASNIRVYDASGGLIPNWPQPIIGCGCVATSPSLADLDGDGKLDIVVAGRGEIYVFAGSGMPLPGWPQPVSALNGALISSNVTIGDLNGDRKLDLAHLQDDGTLYIWNSNGTLFPNMPTNFDQSGFVTNCWSTPVITDLRGDGQTDIVFSLFYNGSFGGSPGSTFATIIGLDFSGRSTPNDWPTFHRDNRHTGIME